MLRATAASTDVLIANLYEAIFDPALLDDFLQELAVRTESRAVHLALFDDRSDAILFDASGGVVGSTPEELSEIRRSYDTVYAKLDYRRIHLLSVPIGQWFQCHDVFSGHRLKRERFFREFIERWDYRYFAGLRIGQGGGLTTYLGLNRRAEQGPAETEDMRFLRQLTIHLMRAAKLFYKTRNFRTHFAPGLESLQYLPSGIFMLDQWQRVLFANAAAENLFRDEAGFSLLDGVLEVSAAPLRNRFTDTVQRVLRSGVPSAMLLAPPDGPRGGGLPCYILRLPQSNSAYHLRGDPAVLVLVPQAAPNPPEAIALLRALYSLSRREAELASAIASGATPQEYATAAGLEISTVRSQLKSVFVKTGTHRQTELVRLLSVLPRLPLG